MGFKTNILQAFSALLYRKIQREAKKAIRHQEKWRKQLIQKAKNTHYGQNHQWDSITNYDTFKAKVPLVDYATLEPWINRIRKGEENVLWTGKPAYIAKTSGTSGDFKYIPITADAMPYHIKAARNALVAYIACTKNPAFLNGKMLFLQGSPKLETIHGIKTGRLSGIVAHHVPAYLQANRVPDIAINCLEDWDEKTTAISKEIMQADMRLFAGIPSWLLHFFEKHLAASGQTNLADMYPQLQVLVHGGVNIEPYREKLNALFGKKIDVVETYPATEGFIAYQNTIAEKGLLLNTNAGIFYEFIALDDYLNNRMNRMDLTQVQLDKNYVLVLNTNSGLFGYVIGDTVKFVSLNPFKIEVTGRIKEYVSAFGEQVYAHQTDAALAIALVGCGAMISEYHVFPQLKMGAEKPCHVWLIEFEKLPADITSFARKLDAAMHLQNIYYRDIVHTGVIKPLEVMALPKNSFYKGMQKMGKVGEQNKIPKLSNNTVFAELVLENNSKNI